MKALRWHNRSDIQHATKRAAAIPRACLMALHMITNSLAKITGASLVHIRPPTPEENIDTRIRPQIIDIHATNP